MPDIEGIHHISITVTDIDRSVPWYGEVLGLTTLMENRPSGAPGYILLGKPDWSMCVGLHSHPSNDHERFSESRTGLDHASFLVGDREQLDAWEARLTELDVEHSPVDQQPGYAVLVFRDPDNVQLELIATG